MKHYSIKNKIACLFPAIPYKTLLFILLIQYTTANCDSNYCSSCPNHDSYCQTCQTGYKAFSGRCCSQYCTTCTSGSSSHLGVCGSCINSSYVYNSSKTQCAPCSILMPNCIECTSNISCTTCAPNYVNNISSCLSCLSGMNFCIACTSFNVCIGCANNSFAINSTNKCVSCSSIMTGCIACNSTTVCTACSNNTLFINSTNQCAPCSSTLVGCLYCNSSLNCTACLNNSFALNSSNLCEPCSSIMLDCLTCSSATNCTACASNTSIINSTFQCDACSSVMDGCVTCTSATVCTSCANDTITVNPTTKLCENCSVIIVGCSNCNSETNCIACLNTSYVLNSSTHLCDICSSLMPQCLTCTAATLCTSCSTDQYAINSTNQCAICSSLLVGCSNCDSSTICTACLNTSFFLNSSTKVCDPCSSLISQCSTCTSHVVCTACVSNLYFVANPPNECALCSTLLDDCLHCSSSTECIDCVNDTFAINSSNTQCQPCFSFMSFCVNCNSNTICTKCQINPSVILLDQKCVSCSSIIPNCLSCTTSTNCTLCDRYYIINSEFKCSLCSSYMFGCVECTSTNVCTKCSLGKIVTNGCSSTPGCLSVVQTSQNTKCTLCNLTLFQQYPVDGKCICLKGHLAGQFCTEIIGCTNAVSNIEGTLCSVCDISKQFELSNGGCSCLKYFQLKYQSCSEICGDGRLIYLPCDDGNLLNGDGCSQNCQIQTGYICKDGTINHQSKCIYRGLVKLQYLCVDKLENNTAQITLTTNPFIPNILKSNLIIDFRAQKNCTLISSQFSGENIILLISYFQNVEGSNINITLEYDQDYITSPQGYKSIQLNQCSGDVLYYDPNPEKSSKQTIMFIIEILNIIVLLVWLIGSYSHKMIGVETLHTFQLIIIPHAFAKNYLPVLVYFSKFCSMLNLYQKKIMPQSTLAQTYLNRLNYSADFVYNNGIVAMVQLLILIVFLSFFFYNKYTNKKDNQQRKQKRKLNLNKMEQQKIKSRNIRKYKIFIYNFLIFPCFIGFQLNSILSIMIHSKNSFSKDFGHQIIQNLTLVFSICCTSFIFFWEWKYFFIENKRKQQIQTSYKQNYAPVYLTNFFFLCLIIQSYVFSLISHPFYLILGLTIIYTIIILIYRPYRSLLHNACLLINNIGIMLSLLWVLSQQFLYLPKAKQQLLAICLIAWMVIILALAIIRIIYQLRNKKSFSKEYKKVKQQRKKSQDYEMQIMRAIEQQASKKINSYLVQSQLLAIKKIEEQQLSQQRREQIHQLSKQFRRNNKESLRVPFNQMLERQSQF